MLLFIQIAVRYSQSQLKEHAGVIYYRNVFFFVICTPAFLNVPVITIAVIAYKRLTLLELRRINIMIIDSSVYLKKKCLATAGSRLCFTARVLNSGVISRRTVVRRFICVSNVNSSCSVESALSIHLIWVKVQCEHLRKGS